MTCFAVAHGLAFGQVEQLIQQDTVTATRPTAQRAKWNTSAAVASQLQTTKTCQTRQASDTLTRRHPEADG